MHKFVGIAYYSQRFARHLQQSGVEVSVQCLDTLPMGSPFGACYWLEIAWLFGAWQQWQSAPMIGTMSQTQWQQQSRLCRHHWTDFVKGKK